MPYQRLTFRPGINKDVSSYAGEGGYRESDKVRFRQGLPEKIGGWVKYSNIDSTGDIDGVPTAILRWRQNNGIFNTAIATNTSIYIEQGGTYYDITPTTDYAAGESVGTYGLGWGAGAWGDSTWGTPRDSSNIALHPRTWSLALWGEDLIFCYRGGSVYTWDASLGAGTAATLITQAPSPVDHLFVTSPDRHLVTLGASLTGSQNKMEVTWCSQEDFETWAPLATNTAGSQVLSNGSEIIGGITSDGQNLIWTDVDMHSMLFIGPPYTFGFQQAGTNCGLVGPNARVVFNNTTFWMGNGNFFIYQGGVSVLPCTLLSHVFEDINLLQRNKVFCGLNSEFNEITWFYCSESSVTVDSYVTYNTTEKVWYPGTMDRTAWIDRGVYNHPLATNNAGQVYEHENGVDDDTSAMTSYIESSDFDIGEGDQLMLVSKVIPDFSQLTGTVDITFKSRRYSQSAQISGLAHTITPTTEKISTRFRGRQLAVRIESNALGDDWRYGVPRINLQPDGER